MRPSPRRCASLPLGPVSRKFPGRVSEKLQNTVKSAQQSVVSHFQISSSHHPFPLSLALPAEGEGTQTGVSPSPLAGEGRGEGETGAGRPNVQPVHVSQSFQSEPLPAGAALHKKSCFRATFCAS